MNGFRSRCERCFVSGPITFQPALLCVYVREFIVTALFWWILASVRVAGQQTNANSQWRQPYCRQLRDDPTLNWRPMLPGWSGKMLLYIGRPNWYSGAMLFAFTSSRVRANILRREKKGCQPDKVFGVSSYLYSICKNGIQYLKIYESMNLACYLRVCGCVYVRVGVCMATWNTDTPSPHSAPQSVLAKVRRTGGHAVAQTRAAAHIGLCISQKSVGQSRKSKANTAN